MGKSEAAAQANSVSVEKQSGALAGTKRAQWAKKANVRLFGLKWA
jgi:hypothetical protein